MKYYLLSATPRDGIAADVLVRERLGQGFWGLQNTARYRMSITTGDRCCFHASGVGIVAHARVAGPATEIPAWEHKSAGDRNRVRLPLNEIELTGPVKLDATLRSQLAAFEEKDPVNHWSWFVQTTFKLCEEDFNLLIGR